MAPPVEEAEGEAELGVRGGQDGGGACVPGESAPCSPDSNHHWRAQLEAQIRAKFAR